MFRIGTSNRSGPVILALSVLMATGCRDASEVGSTGQPPLEPQPPTFVRVQPELFAADGAQTVTWADYDGDLDLDLFVGFRGRANRLYRNDTGTFTDVAAEVGLADEAETRGTAWGDFDGDGDLDVYVGFATDQTPNRLYRNDGGTFTNVADELGVSRSGVTRQPTFVDYDGDGDLDLFVAFRDRPNTLFRNDGASFTDVTTSSGIGDPRRTVGVAWFDIDGDADLDAFVANQNGDDDGLFRNLGDGTFEDVAAELGMNQPGRDEAFGSVGTALTDYDNDGDLDLFVASYGPDVLWRNNGDGTFTDVAPGTPLAGDHHSVSAAWGDYDGDGWPDLYVDTFLSDEAEAKDYLFRNVEGVFEEVTPAAFLERGASHGLAFADFDFDGDLDLALANNHADGEHPLYRNDRLPSPAGSWLQVGLTNGDGAWTRAGATIVVRRPSDGFISARMLETGGGYSSQSVGPVHFTVPPGAGPLTLSIQWFEDGMARSSEISGIDARAFAGRWAVLELALDG